MNEFNPTSEDFYPPAIFPDSSTAFPDLESGAWQKIENSGYWIESVNRNYDIYWKIEKLEDGFRWEWGETGENWIDRSKKQFSTAEDALFDLRMFHHKRVAIAHAKHAIAYAEAEEISVENLASLPL